MVRQFTHPELGKEVRAPAGYYVPVEEHVMPYKGREVIYVIGHACVEASCCATGSWTYIQVPGYLVNKHVRGYGTAAPISEIEAIEDEDDRAFITGSLRQKHPSSIIEIL